jgi:hypothetical protein
MGSSGSGGSGAGGMSLASVGLSAYSDLLKGQSTATYDNFQAEKLDTAATYGELKGVQVGGQMTRSLNNSLGNIEAVMAAARADPNSPTGAAILTDQENIGTDQKNIAVNSILQQARQDTADAAYYRKASSNALLSGDISAGADIAGAIGKAGLGFATGGASLAVPGLSLTGTGGLF